MRERRWARGISASGALLLVLSLGGCGTEKEEEPKVEATQKASQSDKNQELLRKAYRSIGEGDVPAALALYDDGIVFHVPGTSLLSGDHAGKAAVGVTMRKFQELSGGTFKLQPVQIVANEEYGFVLAQASAGRNGKTISEEPMQLWRFEDGEPVEIWLYPRDQQAFNEFWS
jgi:ketosteroid isomerase-like protein